MSGGRYSRAKSAREKPALRSGRPLHRRADAVAVAEIDVVAHADLVAVVHDRASGQREEQGVEQLDDPAVVVEQREQAAGDAEVAPHERVLGVLVPHVVALVVGDHLERELVVVAKEQSPLAVLGDLRRLGHDLGDRVPLLPAHRHVHAGHDGKVERHVALVALAEVGDDVGRPLVGLGQQDGAGELVIDRLADAPQVLVGLGKVLAVGSVPLEQVRHGVEPKAVQPELEPEADDVEHGVAHLRVVEVQVGLMMEEPVPVELIARRVVGPVRRLVVDEDDAGIRVPGVVVGPHVPVGLGVVAALARLLEPRVVVAGVVHHQVGDEADVAAVRLLDERGGVVDRCRTRAER